MSLLSGLLVLVLVPTGDWRHRLIRYRVRSVCAVVFSWARRSRCRRNIPSLWLKIGYTHARRGLPCSGRCINAVRARLGLGLLLVIHERSCQDECRGEHQSLSPFRTLAIQNVPPPNAGHRSRRAVSVLEGEIQPADRSASSSQPGRRTCHARVLRVSNCVPALRRITSTMCL